jgi:hypothetical protein
MLLPEPGDDLDLDFGCWTVYCLLETDGVSHTFTYIILSLLSLRFIQIGEQKRVKMHLRVFSLIPSLHYGPYYVSSFFVSAWNLFSPFFDFHFMNIK